MVSRYLACVFSVFSRSFTFKIFFISVCCFHKDHLLWSRSNTIYTFVGNAVTSLSTTLREKLPCFHSSIQNRCHKHSNIILLIQKSIWHNHGTSIILPCWTKNEIILIKIGKNKRELVCLKQLNHRKRGMINQKLGWNLWKHIKKAAWYNLSRQLWGDHAGPRIFARLAWRQSGIPRERNSR